MERALLLSLAGVLAILAGALWRGITPTSPRGRVVVIVVASLLSAGAVGAVVAAFVLPPTEGSGPLLEPTDFDPLGSAAAETPQVPLNATGVNTTKQPTPATPAAPVPVPITPAEAAPTIAEQYQYDFEVHDSNQAALAGPALCKYFNDTDRKTILAEIPVIDARCPTTLSEPVAYLIVTRFNDGRAVVAEQFLGGQPMAAGSSEEYDRRAPARDHAPLIPSNWSPRVGETIYVPMTILHSEPYAPGIRAECLWYDDNGGEHGSVGSNFVPNAPNGSVLTCPLHVTSELAEKRICFAYTVWSDIGGSKATDSWKSEMCITPRA